MTLAEYMSFLNEAMIEIGIANKEALPLESVDDTFDSRGLDSLDITMLVGEVGEYFNLPTAIEHKGYMPSIANGSITVQDTITWVNTYGTEEVI
jgi:acyl carrier protein